MESDTVIRSGTKIGSKELFTDMLEVSVNECKFDKEQNVILKPKGTSALTETLGINTEL